jgi:hypothetical protein
MDGLTKKETPDRSKINMHQPHEVHYWTKHLNVSKEELQKAIDKVGNSAAAVRKQTGDQRLMMYALVASRMAILMAMMNK